LSLKSATKLVRSTIYCAVLYCVIDFNSLIHWSKLLTMDHQMHTGQDHQPQHTMVHHMSMDMVFTYGYETTLLFESWKTTTYMEYLFSILFVFCLGVFREKVKNNYASTLGSFVEAANKATNVNSATTNSNNSEGKMILSISYGLMYMYDFILMLIGMSMNAGIFLSLCTGVTFGHYKYIRAHSMTDSLSLQASGCHS